MRSRSAWPAKVMISARRRSRQLAMNRIRVAKNSRNSVKVGDRNSSAGWTQSNFGIWNDVRGLEPPTMPCSSCHSASGRSNTCSFSFSMRSQLRQAVAPFHQRRGNQADDEGRDRADREHDQDRGHGAGNAAPLEKARGRRQHGAHHERRHDREKECLGERRARRRRRSPAARPARRRPPRPAGSPAAVRFGCRAAAYRPLRWKAHARWEGHATGSPRGWRLIG